MQLRCYIFSFFLLFSFWGQAQKTYFITTESEDQELIIDGQKWNGKAFFTVDSGKSLAEVIVKQEGYKTEYDILHENSNHTYSSKHFINVDTNIIAIIKPIQLDFVKEDFDFQTHSLDHATFLKDLDHDGSLQEYTKMENEGEILNSIKPSLRYITNDLNNYHNSTIGRYKFYILATINSLKLYEISLSETEKFIQVHVDVDWSITSKNTENLKQYPHPGKSGKIIFKQKKSMDTINLAVNDAIVDSMLYFLEEQELRIIEALKF